MKTYREMTTEELKARIKRAEVDLASWVWGERYPRQPFAKFAVKDEIERMKSVLKSKLKE